MKYCSVLRYTPIQSCVARPVFSERKTNNNPYQPGVYNMECVLFIIPTKEKSTYPPTTPPGLSNHHFGCLVQQKCLEFAHFRPCFKDPSLQICSQAIPSRSVPDGILCDRSNIPGYTEAITSNYRNILDAQYVCSYVKSEW